MMPKINRNISFGFFKACHWANQNPEHNPHMQANTDYEDVVKDVFRELGTIKEKSLKSGIKDIILDPGFGFAKTVEQNYYILKNLSYFKQLESPLLVGISRKSMIYKVLEIDPTDALNGTTALNSIALFRGADILRVHDVKEAVEATKLITTLNDSGF